MKKFISIVFAAMLTLFCVAVPVKADSIFDTAKSIEAGKKYSNKINDTTKSHNYKIQVDGKGTMSITITSDLNYLDFEVFDSDGTKLSPDKKDIKTGSVSFDNITYYTNNTTGTFKGTISFSVKKGTYYLHFGRPSYLYPNGKFSFSVKTPDGKGKETVSAPKSSIRVYMEKGNKIDLSAVASGKDVTAKWSSSNEKVAKVNSKGTITAVSKGTCTITWKSSSATFTIYIEVE